MGAYLEIVSVDAPSEALAGETVNVSVFAYNKTTSRIFAIVTADCNGTPFATSSHWVEPSRQRIFGFSFLMPSGDVTIWCWVWSWDWTVSAWSSTPEDEYGPVVVRLGGEPPPPEIDGDIESLKVYAEGTAPVYPPMNVAPGKKVSIKFDAHSGYGSFPFGLWFDATVILKKPVSGNQERYDKSQTGPYSKCTLDHFDFSYDWTADEKGTYYATVILRARSSLYGSSVEVDRKTNIKVFTVTEDIPPPEIAGIIENLKVYAEGTAPVTPPLLNVTPGKKVSIKFDAHSGYGSFPFGLWFDAYAILKKPVSGSQSKYDRSETGPYSKCTLDHFDFSYDWTADEKGTYYADIILKARSFLIGSSVEVARKTNIKVFTVTQDVPLPDEYTGEITKVQGRAGVANWGAIPLTLEQGDGYSIAVTAVNKSSIALVLRGTLTITKQSGNKEYASDFTGTALPYIEMTVSPNASHTFKWNPYLQIHAFTADEVGDYQGSFALQGKKAGEPDSGYKALCDPWEDTLATVTGAVPPDGPTGKAEIVRKALDFELIGSGYEIPVTKAVSVPEHARLSIIAKTISTEKERLKAEVWIYGPAAVTGQEQGTEVTHGPLKYHYVDTSSWPCCDPETQHEFIFPTWPGTFLIDEEGQWTITINITDASDDELLASYDGVMCGAAKAAPSIWGILMEMMPLIMIVMVVAMVVPMTKELGAGE